ncbi:MAG: penicillin-binding protein activator [Ketobacteraceae bacterium]|nr:penicillin-binding protein activator [Ketobacteraceae bacterium]
MKIKTLFIALILITIAGCDNARIQPDETTSPSDPVANLLEQASTLPSPQAEKLMLQAVELLRKDNKKDEAQRILDSIDPQILTGPLKAEFILEASRLALMDQNLELAKKLLTTDKMQLLTIEPTLPVELQNEISLLRAVVYEYNGEFFQAAQERIFVASMLPEPERLANQEMIWQDLTAIPTEMLEVLSGNAANPETRGWFELGYLYKAYQDDLDNQIHQLNQWQQRFPNHPANIDMPHAIAVLTDLLRQRPSRIAVLLPTQGKLSPAARAIRNGFMSAHYAAMETRQQLSNDQPPLLIRFYDSSTASLFEKNYQQAVEDGAQLVIGPLQKENVKYLQRQGPLPVPTIALNYGIPDWENPSNLFQFGLSAEDEAREVAERAWNLEYESAGVLYPEGEWGQRVYDAFAEHWLSLDGAVTASAAYSENNRLSDAIKQMLLIEQSQNRFHELSRIIGMRPEFQPRRRQDIDFVFVFASPQQGRQIKPLFDFHYASDIPLLASSRIYEGEPSPDLDKDMNGVEFCDIPWVFGESSKAKAMLEQAWPDADYRFHRLHALGVDAYRLHSRIQLLTAVEGAKFFGATGSLSLTPQNTIQRSLTWAKFKGGYAKEIPNIQRTRETGAPVEGQPDISQGSTDTLSGPAYGTEGTPTPGSGRVAL